MAFFTAALSPEPGEPAMETSDEVLAEVCRTLALLAEASPDGAPELEQLLLSALTLASFIKVIHSVFLGKRPDILKKTGPAPLNY